MKTRLLITAIPEGEALPNVAVEVRAIASGAAIVSLATDDNGWLEISRNGNLPPYYLYIPDAPGGAYWRSDETKASGAIAPAEIPILMRTLGDGIIRGYGDELEVSLSGALTFTVALGAASVLGHPFVTYTVPQTAIVRPQASTRVDRVVIRLNPDGSGTTPGAADLAVVEGTEGAGTPALTQTTEVWEFSLATLTVPLAGAVTLTDDRAFAGELNAVRRVAVDDTATTDSAVGAELAGTSVTLQLTRSVPYDISAMVVGRQLVEAGVAGGWTNTVFGSSGSGTGNFNSPQQIAIDSSGYLYIADELNNRIIKRDSAGGYVSTPVSGLSSLPEGVAVDTSGNIYVGLTNAVRKYSSAGVLQWTATIGEITNHITTDSTTVYVAAASGTDCWTIACSDGDTNELVGVTGIGTPYGIATDGTHLYISDRVAAGLIYKFTVAGALVTSWGASGTEGAGKFESPRGVAIAPDTTIWVADFGNDCLQQFSNTGTYLQSIASVADPDGIAVAADGSLWVSNETADTITHYVYTAPVEASGYGEIALAFDGTPGTYVGIGDRDGTVGNAATTTATGPTTVTVSAYGKATTGDITLEDVVLWAKARPRR